MLSKNSHLTKNWWSSENRKINAILYWPKINWYLFYKIFKFILGSTWTALGTIFALMNRKNETLGFHSALCMLKLNMIIVKLLCIWTKQRKASPTIVKSYILLVKVFSFTLFCGVNFLFVYIINIVPVFPLLHKCDIDVSCKAVFEIQRVISFSISSQNIQVLYTNILIVYSAKFI